MSSQPAENDTSNLNNEEETLIKISEVISNINNGDNFFTLMAYNLFNEYFD